MTFQRVDRFEGDRVVHVDRVFRGSHQEMTTMGEKANARLSNGEFMENPHVVDEDVEETDLVREASGNVEAVRMDADAVDLLVELLSKLKSEALVVPNPGWRSKIESLT